MFSHAEHLAFPQNPLCSIASMPLHRLFASSGMPSLPLQLPCTWLTPTCLTGLGLGVRKSFLGVELSGPKALSPRPPPLSFIEVKLTIFLYFFYLINYLPAAHLSGPPESSQTLPCSPLIYSHIFFLFIVYITKGNDRSGRVFN